MRKNTGGEAWNWRQCWYPNIPGETLLPGLIQLETNGPWWFIPHEALRTKTFGEGRSPVSTEGFVGPFTFASSEEAYATYILCGGEPPHGN